MAAVDPEILQVIRDTNWNEVGVKLRLFAERRLKRMIWLGILGGPLPQGHQADDFIREAIEQFLTGKRKWNKAKVSFQGFLMGIVRSRINHLATSPENKMTSRIEHASSGDGDQTSPFQVFSQVSQLIAPQSQSDAEFVRHREQILTALVDDPLVQEIARLIIDDDIDEPRNLAAILSKDIDEINNAKRRLKLRVRKLKASQCVVAGRGSNA